MGVTTDVRVRQPAKDDLVGRRFLVAGVGNGFEGTIGIRVLDGRGRVLAEDSAQSTGGMAAVGEFSTRVTVSSPPRDGTRLTVQVFGDNPGLPDEGPSPGFNLRDYTRTTVVQVVAANPRITDPDVIRVGQRLRIPVKG